MKITDFLRPSDVIADLSGSTAEEVLAELCRPVATSESLDAQVLLHQLLAREKLGSTGIGEGMAIPHSRVPNLAGLRATIGRSRCGVDFKSVDSRPASLFVALFAPAAGPGLHLHALSRISRIFKSRPFRESLLAATDAAEIHRLIEAEDARS